DSSIVQAHSQREDQFSHRVAHPPPGSIGWIVHFGGFGLPTVASKPAYCQYPAVLQKRGGVKESGEHHIPCSNHLLRVANVDCEHEERKQNMKAAAHLRLLLTGDTLVPY